MIYVLLAWYSRAFRIALVVIYQFSCILKVFFNLPGVVCLREALPSHEVAFHTMLRCSGIKDPFDLPFLNTIDINRLWNIAAFSQAIRL